MAPNQVDSGESRQKTPYAVLCPRDGQVFLTQLEYDRQVDNAEALWFCPRCGEWGVFDDANYERSF